MSVYLNFSQYVAEITADDIAAVERRKYNYDAVTSRDLCTKHAVHVKHIVYCSLFIIYSVPIDIYVINTQNLVHSERV